MNIIIYGPSPHKVFERTYSNCIKGQTIQKVPKPFKKKKKRSNREKLSAGPKHTLKPLTLLLFAKF